MLIYQHAPGGGYLPPQEYAQELPLTLSLPWLTDGAQITLVGVHRHHSVAATVQDGKAVFDAALPDDVYTPHVALGGTYTPLQPFRFARSAGSAVCASADVDYPAVIGDLLRRVAELETAAEGLRIRLTAETGARSTADLAINQALQALLTAQDDAYMDL